TDRGVVRYDGFEFEVFTIEDGLADDVMFKIYEDHKGRIWFVSFSLNLSYYYNGHIEHYQFNHKHPKYTKSPIITDFHVDGSDAVYVSLRDRGYYVIDKKGDIDLKYAYDGTNAAPCYFGQNQRECCAVWNLIKLGDKTFLYSSIPEEKSEDVHLNIIFLDTIYKLPSNELGYNNFLELFNYNVVSEVYYLNLYSSLF